jgi:uncharacterized protein (DUF1330 family)
MAVYLIGAMDIHDQDEFANYVKAAGGALAPYQGKFTRLTADKNPRVYEGERPGNHMFIIKFDTQELFDEFYNSEAYRQAMKIRLRSSNPHFIMTMAES